ncbi:hypothetical protein D6779_08285, partial [Candidatus Parcubacteria bacterium]
MGAHPGMKTWVEISRTACAHNYRVFRKLIARRVQMWAVVKSNAYGHSLIDFSLLMDRLGVDGFCVDSVVEGAKLRRAGIRKRILVLGPTLARDLERAAEEDITITVSNKDVLVSLFKLRRPPCFHLKIDTGMHRQGFFAAEVPRVIRLLRRGGKEIAAKLCGVY